MNRRGFFGTLVLITVAIIVFKFFMQLIRDSLLYHLDVLNFPCDEQLIGVITVFICFYLISGVAIYAIDLYDRLFSQGNI